MANPSGQVLTTTTRGGRTFFLNAAASRRMLRTVGCTRKKYTRFTL